MQARHKTPEVYFEEQATSCRNYYIPYITGNTGMKPGAAGDDVIVDVLEIGCGFGGILSVFAEAGCAVTGLDINRRSIGLAEGFFAGRGLEGTFVCSDVFDYSDERRYDLVILHDSLEHISEKERLMFKIKELMKDSGILYLGFPPWQMPFGGHQQMAESKFLANAPWIHLLPRWLFGAVFRLFGATGSAVESFLRLRDTGISIERFERLVNKSGYRVVNRLLYLINPHYRVKFGLKPRVLPSFIARVPYLRDFFTTTCYYLLKKS